MVYAVWNVITHNIKEIFHLSTHWALVYLTIDWNVQLTHCSLGDVTEVLNVQFTYTSCTFLWVIYHKFSANCPQASATEPFIDNESILVQVAAFWLTINILSKPRLKYMMLYDVARPLWVNKINAMTHIATGSFHMTLQHVKPNSWLCRQSSCSYFKHPPLPLKFYVSTEYEHHVGIKPYQNLHWNAFIYID